MIYWIIKPVKSRSKTRFMPIGWRLSTSQNNHNVALGFRAIFVPFLIKKRHFSQVFVPHILIFKKLHLLLLPKMEVQAENGLKITNLHIIRYLPTCWLYLLECYTIDNQRCTHTASASKANHIYPVIPKTKTMRDFPL